ncbi:uncharacterized protein [Lepisosteus oculatus]|uniref:uncharacterized protein isoform X2 n=1 Tax=Lepisosteus oculatus TaxID=7918 RepID=UPI003715AE37
MLLDNTKPCTFWVFVNWALVLATAQDGCEEVKPQKVTKVEAALDSGILVPCNFSTSLLNQSKTKDWEVVWTFNNSNSETSLVQILSSGRERFLENKKGRLRVFPGLSEKGNFSIRIEQLQPHDMGTYHCKFLAGRSCLEIQGIEFSPGSGSSVWESWYVIGSAGGLGVIILLPFFVLCLRRRGCRRLADPSKNLGHGKNSRAGQSLETIYGNMSFHKENTMDVTIYENSLHDPEHREHVRRDPVITQSFGGVKKTKSTKPDYVNQRELSESMDTQRAREKKKSEGVKKRREQSVKYENPIYANSREHLNQL